MSIAPPGHEERRAQASPPRPPEPQQDVRYESKSVQVMRGREKRAKAKWQSQGWKCVSEDCGRLRTQLTFRREQPKSLSSLLLHAADAVRRSCSGFPRQKLVAAGAVLVTVGGIGAVLTRSGADGNPARAEVQPAVAAPTAPPAQPTATSDTVTDTTVDELSDMIDADTLELGDRFRVTAEPVRSDLWGIGAAGKYTVYLQSEVGSDLMVFADEAKASQWQDGSQVEMVLQATEVSVDGEQMSGFLETLSATVVPTVASESPDSDESGAADPPLDSTENASDMGSNAEPREFENCDAVRAAGLAPLERGDGTYESNSHMDRDGDGIACE